MARECCWVSSKWELAHAKHSNSIGGCNMEHMAAHKMSFPLEMLLRTYTSQVNCRQRTVTSSPKSKMRSDEMATRRVRQQSGSAGRTWPRGTAG
ncbi:hypothetical protein TRIATDRAFT_297587 [Trichoderma atroviride IMI 206040]|uniref:Uncharacterized protein n=1 Tax=Hypocrea atroviridis (strain ATCC 20476 / IMI 206040) TaxID=452589 RepID=G9NIR6_HYPAI|nr:uncharacterized protein TRIATDRAFT_297587 [Trichoderma atroviride IMI 206040]EHK49676.1 hypothetical protein TRIATDRAFT_297587 [Trichoderma atroviride IMI 206040]